MRKILQRFWFLRYAIYGMIRFKKVSTTQGSIFSPTFGDVGSYNVVAARRSPIWPFLNLGLAENRLETRQSAGLLCQHPPLQTL